MKERSAESVLGQSARRLREAKRTDADWDAQALFEYVFGIGRAEYYMDPQRQLDPDRIRLYEELTERRAEGCPLQYITGTQDFMGFTFRTDKRALIPRLDTEVLVSAVLEHMKPGHKVLDMCTGSGCIIISIKKLYPDCEAYGADVSEDAIALAEENASLLDADVSFLKGDLFEPVEKDELFDIIISNPPYIRRSDIEGLMTEVRDYEPVRALDGHEDGLYFYRKISEEALKHLKKGGLIFYEIGYDQAADVSEILKINGFSDITVKKDLAGLDRVVYAKL